MKAVTFQGNDTPLTIEDIPRPSPGPGELLLEVGACGICGSDLHAYQTALPPKGNAFGHEFAGRIVAIGDGLGDEWQVGDRATALGGMICGSCEKCAGGNFQECENLELIGFTRNGAYAEYVICQAVSSTKLPENISASEAALVEPMAVGLSAFRDCELPLGGNVLVIGAGIIGVAVLKWARYFGAENVMISDLDAARLERAKELGATGTINAAEQENAVEAFKNATGAEPDVIVECVGKPMLNQLVEIAPFGSRIVSVGAAMEADAIVPWTAANRKISLAFAFGYTLDDFQFILRLLERGRITTEGLITKTVSLDEVPETFAALMKPNGHCKVMIEN